MPWKECKPMDERLKFIARLLDGEKMAVAVPRVRHLPQDRLQDPHALQRDRPGRAHRSLAPALSARQPAAVPDRDADRPAQAGQAELGRAEDQGASWPGSIRMCTRRRSARCTRCSTATAWSSAGRGGAIGRPEQRFLFPVSPMTCGAPTTRASSCSPIGAIAIR